MQLWLSMIDVACVEQKYKTQQQRPRLPPSSSAESTEEMRRKRLERLQGSSTTTASSSASSSPSTSSSSALTSGSPDNGRSVAVPAQEERKLRAKEAMDEYLKQQEEAHRIRENRARQAQQERQEAIVASYAKKQISPSAPISSDSLSQEQKGIKRSSEDKIKKNDNREEEKNKRRREEDEMEVQIEPQKQTENEQEAADLVNDEQKQAQQIHSVISRILNADFTEAETQPPKSVCSQLARLISVSSNRLALPSISLAPPKVLVSIAYHGLLLSYLQNNRHFF